jgi:hypothetical protein
MKNRKIKETNDQRRARHAEIERLFREIKILVDASKLEDAWELRLQAERLRIHW